MKEKKKHMIKKLFPLSLRDWLIFITAMLVPAAVCLFLQNISETDHHVPMIFVLAVLVVSLTTNGYFYGALASVLSVVAVNWMFTYPYFKLDFSIYGYPLTFMTMLAVGIAVSTLTSRVREQERIRNESAKEKMRANLLRAISHDLRTPLTSISGAIGVVLEEGENLDVQQRRELLQDAKHDAEWLHRMVENLLSITRISGDQVSRIKKEDEMLEEVLGEAVMNFRKKNPGIEVSVSVPEDVLFVPMDAMLVEQVIMNLMDNAVSHGVSTDKIRVSAVAGKEYATVIVADNGKGIDRDILDNLFDGTLQAAGDGVADKTRSMGIGLLVCRTIVEAHGGKISASNLPGGGASFAFTLKLGGETYDYQG